MKLFKYDNWELTISEEALCIKSFTSLWKRDRSESKERAKRELGFIYFCYDPRSDYMFIIDEDERAETIKEQEGLDPKWKPDKLVLDAIVVYKFLTQTTASLLLEDTRALIEKIRMQMKEIDLTATDDKGKPIYTLNTITATIKQIPSLSEDLTKAENALNREIEENSKMRGQKAKKLMEDGVLGFTKQ